MRRGTAGTAGLKLIEKKVQRSVTFTKMRNRLIKKAYELSVLCGSEVGVMIFSEHGNLFEFSSNSCMSKTLERYKESVYSKPEKFIFQEGPLKSPEELAKLKAHVEAFQRFMSNLMIEDLGILPRDDLENLESQLESSLKHIRETKEQRGDVLGRLSLLALEEGQGSGNEA